MSAGSDVCPRTFDPDRNTDHLSANGPHVPISCVLNVARARIVFSSDDRSSLIHQLWRGKCVFVCVCVCVLCSSNSISLDLVAVENYYSRVPSYCMH